MVDLPEIVCCFQADRVSNAGIVQDDLGCDVADPRNGKRCEIRGTVVEKLLLGSVEVSIVDTEKFEKVGVRTCIDFSRGRLVDESIEADVPALLSEVRVRGSARRT